MNTMRIPREKAKQQEAKRETKILVVRSFIEDEQGRAIGVTGVTFPEKTEIEVLLSTSGKHAANEKRRDFETYRKGFKVPTGTKVKLETGGVLRLTCVQTGENRYETDWINCMAANKDVAQKNMSFKHTGVELFTPEQVKSKRDEIRKQMQQAGGGEVNRTKLEDALREAISGQERFRGNVLVYHNDKITDVPANGLQSALQTYYAQERFAKVANEEGKTYEPISPGVVVRALDADGKVLGALNITGANLYTANAHNPDERADFAAKSSIQHLGSADVAAYSILPYDRIHISHFATLVEKKNIQNINALMRACYYSRKEAVDDSGQPYTEQHALPAAVTYAPNGMARGVSLPDSAVSKSVDVALLDLKGGELPVAERRTTAADAAAPEADDDEESNSPGM